jgi:hypothetical protein
MVGGEEDGNQVSTLGVSHKDPKGPKKGGWGKGSRKSREGMPAGLLWAPLLKDPLPSKLSHWPLQLFLCKVILLANWEIPGTTALNTASTNR